MCGRFYIEADDAPEELLALLNHAERRARQHTPDFHLPRGEIRPGDCAAVVALNRAMSRSVFAMQWGFRLNRRLLINARSETAAGKPIFSSSMQLRRCLIPASAYFEWDHREKPLVKYHFRLPQERLLYLAGLYRFEEGAPLPVFTVLTHEAAPEIACFHDRMPVILPASLADDWLDHRSDPQQLLCHAVTDIQWRRA